MLKVTKYSEGENDEHIILPSMKDVQVLHMNGGEKCVKSTLEIKIKSLFPNRDWPTSYYDQCSNRGNAFIL